MDIGQAEIAALETIGQLGVIEAQQVQQRRVQIVDVDLSFTALKPNSSVSPSVRPGFTPPPAIHMVKALG